MREQWALVIAQPYADWIETRDAREHLCTSVLNHTAMIDYRRARKTCPVERAECLRPLPDVVNPAFQRPFRQFSGGLSQEAKAGFARQSGHPATPLSQ